MIACALADSDALAARSLAHDAPTSANTPAKTTPSARRDDANFIETLLGARTRSVRGETRAHPCRSVCADAGQHGCATGAQRPSAPATFRSSHRACGRLRLPSRPFRIVRITRLADC